MPLNYSLGAGLCRSIFAPKGKYEALGNASQQEACKGSNTDNARSPSNLSTTHLKSSLCQRNTSPIVPLMMTYMYLQVTLL